MILLHRITPFFIGLFAAAGLVGTFFVPEHPLWTIVAALIIVVLLSARLLAWRFKTLQFWTLLGTPVLFLVSGYSLFLFFEDQSAKITMTVIVAMLLFFFAEHVFTYTHLPAKYQAYAIEHLSLLLNLLSLFFFSAAGFGGMILLQSPLYIMGAVFFLLVLFFVYSTLWAGKIENKRALSYSLAGALLATEIFTALSYLPTGFYTNAAVLAVCFYLFLGLSKAHFMNQLSRKVWKRYLFLGFSLLFLIAVTARWL